MKSKRKKLRLENYDYGTAGAYFITVCTADRKPILCTIPPIGANVGPITAPYRVGADDHIGPTTKPYHLGTDVGPTMRLTDLGVVVEKYTRMIPGIDCYVIMPNHIHMIIMIPEEGPTSAPTGGIIQNRIRTWKTLIAKETGKSVWQRSYYDHIIRNDQDYLEKAQYILNNPAKWCEDKYYPGF